MTENLRIGQRLRLIHTINPNDIHFGTFEGYESGEMMIKWDFYNKTLTTLGYQVQVIIDDIVFYWQVWEVSKTPQIVKSTFPTALAAQAWIIERIDEETRIAAQSNESVVSNCYEIRSVPVTI